MDGLTECLVVLGYGIGIGAVGVTVLYLLVTIYLNTRGNKQDDEDEALVIPYSALNAGMGGPGQTISMVDAMRIRAAMGQSPPPEDKKEDDKKDIAGGTYL